jgi:hypothetical protein
MLYVGRPTAGANVGRWSVTYLHACNIPVFGVTKREKTYVCIAFMNRKSGEFSRFYLKLSKWSRFLSHRWNWVSHRCECDKFRHDLCEFMCFRGTIWIQIQIWKVEIQIRIWIGTLNLNKYINIICNSKHIW